MTKFLLLAILSLGTNSAFAAGAQPFVSGPSEMTAGTTNQVQINFDKPVTQFSVADVEVTGGAKNQLIGYGTSYTLDITPNVGSSQVSIRVPRGAAIGPKGGDSLASDIFTSSVSSQPPVAGDLPGQCNGAPLETVAGRNIWGLPSYYSAVIPEGEKRTFCIRAGAPFIPNGAKVNTIWASFDNLPNEVCGRVEIRIEQTFGQRISETSSGNSGSAALNRYVGGGGFGVISEHPENVQRGWYKVTVENKEAFKPGDYCSTYVIRWGWS